MRSYQQEFIEFAITNKVLCFGTFVLKSGRTSPYFFNTGLFNNGLSLARLGQYYLSAITASGIGFDTLFGPAYKGIPLAASVAIAFAGAGQGVPFCFDRKEAKDHGEGGNLFGAPLQGRVLIVDDVISAGTSINNAVRIIRQAGATPAGVVIAMDRQERGLGTLSAVQEVEQNHGFKVTSIVNLDCLIDYLEPLPGMAVHLDQIRAYRERYGSK
mgnify:CR=1 FL=1